MATILFVDDELATGPALQETLERAGHVVVTARGAAQALALLSQRPVDLVLCGRARSEPGTPGLREALQRQGRDVPLLVYPGTGGVELAVAQALELARLRRENDALRREVTECRTARQIVGESVAVRSLLQTVSTAAPTGAAVLLEGESGTGKELFAHAIHDASERRDRPFIKLACGTLPTALAESALFGHEAGAVPGAPAREAGAIERADGGTLLLDEVCELRLDLQARLLRVLQEQALVRVGGSQPIRVDVRIIATASRDLGALVAAGAFRQDLHQRLGAFSVQLPPLRERKQDIPLLAYRFAMRTAQELGKSFEGIAPDALAMLQAYDWPGNVRELQHAVERAVITSPEIVLEPRAFEAMTDGLRASAARMALATNGTNGNGNGTHAVHAETNGAVTAAGVVLTSLDVTEAEAKLIARALLVTKGNRTRAAQLLGISVRTLRNKLNGPRPAVTL